MSDDLPHFPIGAFVESSTNTLGIGKVVGLDEVNATVEYFDAPDGTGLQEHQLPLASLKRVRIEAHTRVYIKDEGLPSWSIATLVWHINSNARVILPGPREENLPTSRIYVRCNSPICDPTLLLANLIVESTTYAHARRRFLSLMSQQKLAAGGMHCLLSSAVDLEHHQVEVVRRVLRDPIQRYLLGDEVGLGKTIEAGLLIRQHIHDQPLGHRVLVIVPQSLKHQWQHELRGRFGLHSELHKTVSVIEVAQLGQLKPTFHPSMVVIDEAHQVAALYRGTGVEQAQFETIRKLSLDAPRLLMLTATPLLHNERDYLTMLHLLDPKIYSVEDIEGFRARVAQRQTIAEACFALKPDTPNGFLEDALQQVQEHLPKDPLVKAAAAKLRARLDVEADESDPERNEAIHKLRTHLNEVYRLHRRLLRNRRVGELKAVTPGRAGMNRVVYTDTPLLQLFEALDQWRSYARSEHTHGFLQDHPEVLRADFATLLAGCLEQGCGLKTFIDSGLLRPVQDHQQPSDVSTSRDLFQGEQSLLDEISKRATAVIQSEARLNALADHLGRNPENATHWVVFCTDPALADKICAHLTTRFGPGPILRHSLDDPHWCKFHYTNTFTVLICDGRAEEGLNLQGHEAVMVHFDLPLSPGRIEQRMGRLDRFSRGDPVRSVVLCADENPWEDAWLAVMNDGLSVFHDSIASLQYSTAEWIARGMAKSFDIGSEAWSELASQLAGEKGEVARERRLIAEQDAMDLMDLSVDDGDALVDRLRALESPAFVQSFSQSLVTWGKQALSIQMFEEDRNHPGVFRLLISEDWTLIPERLFRTYFAGALDTSYRPPPWARDRRVSSRPMSFNRSTAQQRRSLVARYGEKFLDALYEYTRDDDRGTCYALWRCRKSIPKTIEGAYIRLEFVIKADDTAALAASNGAADPLAIRREADALLAPLHLGFWLDADHECVTDAKTLALLNGPLVPPVGPGQEGDFDLDRRRWAALANEPAFRDWHARLRKSLESARTMMPKRPEVIQHLARAKASAEDRLHNFESQMTSRLTVLPDDTRAAEAEQLEKELAWRRALIASMTTPRVLIDSAGVIVLDHRSFKN